MLLERLLDNLALDVEAFATCRVASGWRLRLPALDWVTLHFSVSGEGGVRGSGPVHPLSAGTLAVVPPHLHHSLESGAPPYGESDPTGAPTLEGLPDHTAGPLSDDEDPLLVVCGRISVTYGGGVGLFDRLQDVLILDFSADDTMSSAFAAIRFEAEQARVGSRAMTSALMRGCLIRILRELCEDERCTVPWLEALDDPTLSPAVEAMLDRPEDPHTVASLASEVFMSRSTFARRFREAFGHPPLEYLRGIRLRHASKLLRRVPPLSVATIARRSGFSSRSHFSRAFTDYFGRPPSDFRG